jgi:hypothetical protein
MSDESELQKEWRDIVIKKLNSIEAEQKTMQISLSGNVVIANDVAGIIAKAKVVDEDIKALRIEVKHDREEADRKYVSKQEFTLVEKIVYGASGLILLAVFGALITLVIRK